MHRLLPIALAALLVACSGDDDATPNTNAGMSNATGGMNGSSGVSGSSDVSGSSGANGASGTSGSSGASSMNGASGVNGASGSGGAVDVDGGDVDAGSDAGSMMVPSGPFAVPELPYSVTPGDAIDAPNEQWSFVGFPESKCANGTPTGIAINPIANATGLLVFMQGGGACWDADRCLVSNTSVHLHEDVGEAVVLGEAANLSGLFDHQNAANPFRDYAYVYIAYCTGDLHAGTQAKDYTGPSGTETIYHYGARNLDAYLARLVPTLPAIDRVVVSGISAGGFGSLINWWRYQNAFPNARVDVLDDAGLPVDPNDDRWSIMVDAWNMVLPPGCDACAQHQSAFLPFYADLLVAPRRFALTGFLSDAVIGSYMGLTGDEISAQLLALRDNAADNQKTFFLSGTQHSVIGEGGTMMTSDGQSLVPWILQLATDDPAWDHAGP